MSVNVVVLRYDYTGAEISRWNNLTVTPEFHWFNSYSGYTIAVAGLGWKANDTTYIGSTRTYALPKKIYPELGGTAYATFLLETGYQALVNKSINSADISVSVRTTSSSSSTEKSIYLSGETAYYHSSVIEGSKYRFVDWRNGEILVSTDAVLSQIITADQTLTANYEQYRWSLTAQSSNTTVGDAYIGVSGTATTGIYEDGSFETIRAVVKPEYALTYKFKRWTLGGSEVSTEPTLQITTEDVDKTYVAVFIPINYTLNVTQQNADQGSVETYLAGVKQVTNTGLPVAGLSGVEVRSIASFGYYLTGWHDGTTTVSSSKNFAFSMPEANLSLQARFAILPDADLVVTKKKGTGDEDPDDMGVVTLYHTVNNFVVTSPAGELTLNASVFTTKQYRLVAAPASALFQFDGWYQTVDGTDVLITDDSMFNVDGNDLYISVADEAAINVIARFSTRTLCTISPVVSDSSTYEADNEAEDAGCTCAVTTLPPNNDVDADGAHDVGDQWLSGQTITVEARQAAGWELRAWIVKRVSDGVTVASKAKGETGFGQVFTFALLSDVQVVAVSAYTLQADQVQVQAMLKSGQPLGIGTLEIHPCGENYVELENGATANVADGGKCEITAIPANGYKFLRWRVSSESGTIVSTFPVYTFTVSGNAVYYAEFEAVSEPALLLFEGSAANRTLLWSSKTFVASAPSCFSSARIYANAFPVLLKIGASENPSSPSIAHNTTDSLAVSQDSFRLPMRRPEKYFVFSIRASDVVTDVAIATSMEGLRNG